MADRANLMIQRNGDWYPLDELQRILEPVYQEYETLVKSCISGLTQYAAGLAARRQEGQLPQLPQLPQLRKLITDMAEFWNLEHDESKDAYLKNREKYGGAFDRAVAEARVSGQAPALSSEAQDGILSGLRIYAKEMADSGDMEPWVRQCEALAEQLQEEWAAQGPQMGGMTLE